MTCSSARGVSGTSSEIGRGLDGAHGRLSGAVLGDDALHLEAGGDSDVTADDVTNVRLVAGGRIVGADVVFDTVTVPALASVAPGQTVDQSRFQLLKGAAVEHGFHAIAG